jgi:hypothetical protein
MGQGGLVKIGALLARSKDAQAIREIQPTIASRSAALQTGGDASVCRYGRLEPERREQPS